MTRRGRGAEEEVLFLALNVPLERLQTGSSLAISGLRLVLFGCHRVFNFFKLIFII